MNRLWVKALLFAMLGLVHTIHAAAPPSTPNAVPDAGSYEATVVQKLRSNCDTYDRVACAQLKMLDNMNTLLKKASIELTEEVVVLKTQEVPLHLVFSPREMPAADWWGLLAAKARSFVRSRELRLRLLPQTDLVVTGSEEEVSLKLAAPAEQQARHKVKGLMVLAAAAMAKVGVIAILKFVGLVALVFKAVIVSKIALVLAVMLSLSKLLGGGHVTTYEVVSHPHSHHSDHHESYSSGGFASSGGGFASSGGYSGSSSYARSGHAGGVSSPHSLAYNAHGPK